MKTGLITFAAITYALAGFWLLQQFQPASEELSLPPDTHEVIDYLVDAGFETAPSPVEEELLKARAIVVTTDINAQVSKRIVQQLLLLNARDNQAPINLFLRTEGGWEADAFTIVDAINGLDAPVHVHALGDVNSAGAMILASATGNRIVYPNTVIGFHAWDDEQMRDYEETDALLFRSRYLGFFRRHASLPQEWLEDTSGRLFYMNPRKAVEYQVADFIAQPREERQVAPENLRETARSLQ